MTAVRPTKACSASSDSLVRSPPKGPVPFAVAAMAMRDSRPTASATPLGRNRNAIHTRQGSGRNVSGLVTPAPGEGARKTVSVRQREQGERGDQLAEPPGLAPEVQRLAPGEEDGRENHHADEVAEPPGLPGIQELVGAQHARDAQGRNAPGRGDQAAGRGEAGEQERRRPRLEHPGNADPALRSRRHRRAPARSSRRRSRRR